MKHIKMKDAILDTCCNIGIISTCEKRDLTTFARLVHPVNVINVP